MNKYGIVFGAAAVAVIAGCKDPGYKSANTPSQNEVKAVETEASASPDKAAPVAIEAAPEKKCTCAPGTVHDKPCACGAADCACEVVSKPVVVADVAAKPAVAPVVVTTIYIVQRGDYLAKISKKFNITISSIKRLNPSIGDKNIVRVGQKLKLPGKVDVGVQAEPAKPVAAAVKAPAKKAYAPYSGATKEYVVKSGDTLGGIAYSNGINIRQLKELNGLSKDTLRIGQKLKIPAEKAVAAKAPVAAEKKVEAAKPAAPAPEAVPADANDNKPLDAAALADEVAGKTTTAPEASAEAPAAAEAVASAKPETVTYVVKEGDDMTGVSISWGVSAAEIRELNNLGENDQLVPGQAIKLPAGAQQ